MKLLPRPPLSLSNRVFALYGLTLMIFVLAGMGVFFVYQFHESLSDARASALRLSRVLAPMSADGVVRGDNGALRSTLENVLLPDSLFSSAAFINRDSGQPIVDSR
ncbi:PAS domain-containing sensor histidine kinase, partial [bacterium]|nr:PAS domain-containing sensor histidine kinase [bacterium]